MQNGSFIRIRGAKVHNLKNIDVDIPKNRLVVITGLSGSGKSSLAFDTLYAEGQRRYVESLSAYARQFLGVMRKPDAERIEGISPAISIDQRKGSHNPRSTVGTITEIYDYLRLLYARIGIPHCPVCKKAISCQTPSQIVDQILGIPEAAQASQLPIELLILGPVISGKKGEHQGILEEIQRGGFIRVRIDGFIHRIEEALQLKLDKNKKHSIEAVVDRLELGKEADKIRLADSVETALKLGKGIMIASCKKSGQTKSEDFVFSEKFACEKCGISLPELEPRIFSFNSPFGACPACQGLGVKLEVDPALVIPNSNLSISEGAIFPWAHASHKVGRQGYFWWKLSELASEHKFSLEDPVSSLPKKIMDLILYGQKGGFEGVIPNLERRYRETDSDWTREEIEQYMVEKVCEVCKGKRLKPEVLAVTVAGKSIDQLTEKSIKESSAFFQSLSSPLSEGMDSNQRKIAGPILKEILSRLQFLVDVGLDYLSLDRKAGSLSGGEEQRIRLATQIGSRLSGVLYILDEPSIGLHSRDQLRLILTLKKLRDLGNTVVVVEHDPQTIMAADWVIDIGPGAGKEGGRIMFQGTPKQLLESKTLTGEYLSGKRKVLIQAAPKKEVKKRFLVIKKAQEHNLKSIDVAIPLGRMVCVTGVSGSGKSSLVNDILAKSLLKKFYKAKEVPGKHEKIVGIENLNKIVLVDQSPIGRTPRSNPATYTGLFSSVREIFSKTKEARVRGYGQGRFSFNVKGGRCEACEGQGQIKVEMFFLPDMYVECQECSGTRYNRETLEVEYKGKNIAQVLEMTVAESLDFFKNIPSVSDKLKILSEVGLGYVHLGQPAPSLSGGEAQRIKLASELSKRGTGKALYILDEPTTGLHFDDVKKLVSVLRSLTDKGNTVLVIEHNLDVIKNADWIIDLGPEGGDLGGYIVAEGTPKEVSMSKKSYTGKFLKEEK